LTVIHLDVQKKFDVVSSEQDGLGGKRTLGSLYGVPERKDSGADLIGFEDSVDDGSDKEPIESLNASIVASADTPKEVEEVSYVHLYS
jgi:hypothetical protein